MSAVTPTPAPAVVAQPSKVKIAAHAFVRAIISPAAQKLEFALGRYVLYAVLGALGYKHAGSLGL